MVKKAEVTEASKALQDAYEKHREIHDEWVENQTDSIVKEHAKIVNKIYKMGGQHRLVAMHTSMAGLERTLHQLSTEFENIEEGKTGTTITNKSQRYWKYEVCIHCGKHIHTTEIKDKTLIEHLEETKTSMIVEPRICDDCIEKELETNLEDTPYAICTGCSKDSDGVTKGIIINKSLIVKTQAVNQDERTFWAVVSADNLDKQGDVIEAKAIAEVMPIFMKRGVLIFGHQNVVVGKPVDWTQMKNKDGFTRSYVKFKVFDDFETDNEFWTGIVNGDISKFSIGGLATEENEICTIDPDTGTEMCINRIEQLQLFEISGLPNEVPPANDEAIIIDDSVNKLAKADMEKKVERRGDKWCVIHCHGKDAGKPIEGGCFDTKEEALNMHAAIEANKANTYLCECIECGYKLKSEEHCKDIKCPECSGTMRRVERPGVGQKAEAELEGLTVQFIRDKYQSFIADGQSEIDAIKSLKDYLMTSLNKGDENMEELETEEELVEEEEIENPNEQTEEETSDTGDEAREEEDSPEEEEEPIAKMELPEAVITWMQAVSEKLDLEFPEDLAMDEESEEVEEPAPAPEEVQANEKDIPEEVQEEIFNMKDAQEKLDEKMDDLTKMVKSLVSSVDTPAHKKSIKKKRSKGPKEGVDELFPVPE